MKKKIWGILDRDSSFGRAMTLVSIIIGANIMFAIFSLPVVTIGPALAALFHVMFKMLRGHRDLNPIKEFWYGFKSNFKQGILSSLVFLGIALLLYVDIRFSGHMGGVLTYFKYALYAIAFAHGSRHGLLCGYPASPGQECGVLHGSKSAEDVYHRGARCGSAVPHLSG